MYATTKRWVKPKYDASILEFIADHEDGSIVLYKSVNPETMKDFHTGTIEYSLGAAVDCPDWDPDPSRECGGGLHLSPTALGAYQFNTGKLLKCLVDPADIVVFAGSIDKVRCRRVRPVAVVDRGGRVIESGQS